MRKNFLTGIPITLLILLTMMILYTNNNTSITFNTSNNSQCKLPNYEYEQVNSTNTNNGNITFVNINTIGTIKVDKLNSAVLYDMSFANSLSIYFNPYENHLKPYKTTIKLYENSDLQSVIIDNYMEYGGKMGMYYDPYVWDIEEDNNYIYVIMNVYEGRYRSYDNTYSHNYIDENRFNDYGIVLSSIVLYNKTYTVRYGIAYRTYYKLSIGHYSLIGYTGEFNVTGIGEVPFIGYTRRVCNLAINKCYYQNYTKSSAVRGFTIMKIRKSDGKILWAKTLMYSEVLERPVGYVMYERIATDSKGYKYIQKYPARIKVTYYEPVFVLSPKIVKSNKDILTIVGYTMIHNQTLLLRINVSKSLGQITIDYDQVPKYSTPNIYKDNNVMYSNGISVINNITSVVKNIPIGYNDYSIVLPLENRRVVIIRNNYTAGYSKVSLEYIVANNLNGTVYNHRIIGLPNGNVYLSYDTIVQDFGDYYIVSFRVFDVFQVSEMSGFGLIKISKNDGAIQWIKMYSVPLPQTIIRELKDLVLKYDYRLTTDIIINTYRYYVPLMTLENFKLYISDSIQHNNKLIIDAFLYNTKTVAPFGNKIIERYMTYCPCTQHCDTRSINPHNVEFIYRYLQYVSLWDKYIRDSYGYTYNTHRVYMSPIFIEAIDKSIYNRIVIDTITGEIVSNESIIIEPLDDNITINTVKIKNDRAIIIYTKGYSYGTTLTSDKFIINIKSYSTGELCYRCHCCGYYCRGRCCYETESHAFRHPYQYDKIQEYEKYFGFYAYYGRVYILSAPLDQLPRYGFNIVTYEDLQYATMDIEIKNNN